MAVGFQFAEEMVGTCRFAAGHEPPGRAQGGAEAEVRFSVKARAGSLLQHVRDHRAAIEGTIDVGGFATGRALDGTLHIDLFALRKRRIAYDFTFTGDDGARYRLHGQKDVTPLRPVASMTTLTATITALPDGHEVARCDLRFDLARDNLSRFLGSFRLT